MRLLERAAVLAGSTALAALASMLSVTTAQAAGAPGQPGDAGYGQGMQMSGAAGAPGAAGVSQGQAQAAQAPAAQGTTMTQWGPLTAKDRELIVRVRLAGLWEIPTGQQAQQRAASQRVKEVGQHIAQDHIRLDAQVRQVAAQLGVDLPNQPSAEQQGWMNQLSTMWGSQYDVAWANFLRRAHGKVFSVIADVRANTQNELVRSFAQTANAFVLRHMTLLESTGLVDYASLNGSAQTSGTSAQNQAAGTGQSQAQQLTPTAATVDTGGPTNVIFVLVLLLISVGLGVVVITRVMKTQRAGRW